MIYCERTYKKQRDRSSARPLSSPTCQTTTIRGNCMCKNVSNELYCKTSAPPNKNAYFCPCLFSGNENGNIYKFDSLCPFRSIRPLDHGDQIQFGSGLTVTTLRGMHWWPLTLGNEAENKSVLYRKVSCFSRNILFTVIFI